MGMWAKVVILALVTRTFDYPDAFDSSRGAELVRKVKARAQGTVEFTANC